MQKSIADFAIERCQRLLKTETDPLAAARLERLLVRARLAVDAPAAERSERDKDRTRRRGRAEEYRNLARSSRDEGARRSHVDMARWYDYLGATPDNPEFAIPALDEKLS